MKIDVSLQSLRFRSIDSYQAKPRFEHLAQSDLVFGHLTESRRTRGPR